MIELTAKIFDQHAEALAPLLVKFSAPWCGPCKAMAPAFAAVARDFPYVQFATVDVDANPSLASRHGVRGVPAVMMFTAGQVVARQNGVMTANELSAFIRTHAGA